MSRLVILAETLYQTCLNSKTVEEVAETLSVTKEQIVPRIARLKKSLQEAGLPELTHLVVPRKERKRNKLVNVFKETFPEVCAE